MFSIFAQTSGEFAAAQPDVASWKTPALAIVEPFATFVLKDYILRIPNADGKGTHEEYVLPDPGRSGLTQGQFDAVLVLSPPLE